MKKAFGAMALSAVVSLAASAPIAFAQDDGAGAAPAMGEGDHMDNKKEDGKECGGKKGCNKEMKKNNKKKAKKAAEGAEGHK